MVVPARQFLEDGHLGMVYWGAVQGNPPLLRYLKYTSNNDKDSYEVIAAVGQSNYVYFWSGKMLHHEY